MLGLDALDLAGHVRFPRTVARGVAATKRERVAKQAGARRALAPATRRLWVAELKEQDHLHHGIHKRLFVHWGTTLTSMLSIPASQSAGALLVLL